MSNCDGRCANCGHETPEASYGLKKCVACIQDMVGDFVVVDAFARAVAALMRDVVEEHGSETITGEQLDCIGGCGKRRVRGPQDVMFICKACAPSREAANSAFDAQRPIAWRAPQMPEPPAKAVGVIGKTSCRTCSAELLSDTSRARGTCYDCSEAR